MPHKRKGKVEWDHKTKLLFQPANSFLYLEYFQISSDTIHVPLYTLIPVFVIQYIKAHNIKVFLYKARESSESKEYSIELKQSSFNFELCSELPEAVSRCRLPCWYLPSQLTCLAGLCSVVRYIVKIATFSDQIEAKENEKCIELLGHMYNCLSAPAEVSTWTKFCEVEMPAACASFFTSDSSHLPEELSKLEAHLNQPLRIHNVRKKMQDKWEKDTTNSKTVNEKENASPNQVSAKEVADTQLVSKQETTNSQNENVKEKYKLYKDKKTDSIKAYAKENHIYAEGPDLLISDIILYPCVTSIIQAQESCIRKEFPLLTRWYDRVNNSTSAHSTLESLVVLKEKDSRSFEGIKAVEVPDESLYKCDPSRDSSSKVCTSQIIADKYFQWWEKSDLENLQTYNTEDDHEKKKMDWNDLPKLIHPQAGELPADRLERKCQQLEGLAAPILQLMKNRQDQVIVDFCSGGGHLGLLLAYLIPQATVHMVENKEESLARARERGNQLGLTNVWYYQSNIDYYQGNFTIGTSLHACGVATDLVIQKCIQLEADCVTCPCCYGAVKGVDGVHYPRSQAYKTSGCTEEDYITMGHIADQTERNHVLQEQGELFMDIVDSDRCFHLQDKGYHTSLSKIYPLSCSPKHNTIVATFIAKNGEAT